ncbi:hypothetical protein D3C78_1778890 [compost metagenome]
MDGKGKEPEITPEELGDFEHARGEGEIGVISETSEEFNERMEAIRQQRLREEQVELGMA